MIRYPFDTPPEQGQAIEVADGVLWIRLPLPMALDHVNVYALEGINHQTIVRGGVLAESSSALLKKFFADRRQRLD